MTIRQAIERKIPRIRLPNWADPTAYLQLSDRGVWAAVYDPAGQIAVGVPLGSQKICVALHLDDDDRFVAYEGPIHEEKSP